MVIARHLDRMYCIVCIVKTNLNYAYHEIHDEICLADINHLNVLIVNYDTQFVN